MERHFATTDQDASAEDADGQGRMQGDTKKGDDVARGAEAQVRAEPGAQIQTRRAVTEDDEGSDEKKRKAGEALMVIEEAGKVAREKKGRNDFRAEADHEDTRH